MNKADPKSQGEFLRIEEERRYKAQNGLWRKWGPSVHAWATWRVARLRMGLGRCEIGEAGIGLWDEQDEFYYDVLNLPDGRMVPLKVRSMVGLIPLYAVEVLEPESLEKAPEFAQRLNWFLNYRPDLARLVSRWEEPGRGSAICFRCCEGTE